MFRGVGEKGRIRVEESGNGKGLKDLGSNKGTDRLGVRCRPGILYDPGLLPSAP